MTGRNRPWVLIVLLVGFAAAASRAFSVEKRDVEEAAPAAERQKRSIGLTTAGKSVVAGGLLASIGAVQFYKNAKRRAAARARRQGISEHELDIDGLLLYPERRTKPMKKIVCAYMPWSDKCRRGGPVGGPGSKAFGPHGKRRTTTYRRTAKKLLKKPAEMFNNMKCTIMPNSKFCRRRRWLKAKRRRYY